eukprot:9698427-Lingulodinium_polyedra.AAC.1
MLKARLKARCKRARNVLRNGSIRARSVLQVCFERAPSKRVPSKRAPNVPRACSEHAASVLAACSKHASNMFQRAHGKRARIVFTAWRNR